MVRNMPSITPSRAPGFVLPPWLQRPKPDTTTAGQDRAMVRRAQEAQARQPAGRVVSNAPVVREPVTSRTGLPSIEETNRLLGRGGTPGPDLGADEAPPPPVPGGGRGTPSDLGFADSSYNTQIAALERALRDFETGSATRGQRYQQDFTTGLDRLGFRPAPQPMMAMSAMEGEPTGGGVGFATGKLQGEFDIEGMADRTSAAARGTRGMRDEFAGRGTLRSSDYVNSFRDFQNRLEQQLTGMETGRTRFGEDLETELAQFRARTGEQKAAAEESARSRAIMRSIQEMGF